MSTYEISKSSLLSLKAEILRKEQDLSKAKGENEIKASIIKKNTPLEFKNKGVEARSNRDMTDEEQDLLKLSRSKLAQKAALYDRLSQQAQQSEDDKRRYLVQFDQKENHSEIRNEIDESRDQRTSEDEEERRHDSDEYDSPDNSDEEWIEYIDCVGRSRTCLKKDLDYLKSKDADLKVIEKNRKSANDPNKPEEDNKKEQKDEQTKTEKDKEQELISGDMKREMLRQQWEQEEAELMNKNEVHYQDVLFSEARQHGVGYYSFSKDEEERARQQEALKKLRQETEQQQRKAQDLKTVREKQLAARMKAARNRKRARMGLPPEEDEPEEANKPSETDEEKPSEPSAEERRKIEEEKQLEEARKRHVRPWDVGKDKVSEFYEMTQEEWNEKQRAIRNAEFAPPSIYDNNAKKTTKKPKINPYLNNDMDGRYDRKTNLRSSESDSENEDIPPNIGDSIEAGLKFFRKQTESTSGNIRSFTSTNIVEEQPEEDRTLKFTTKKKDRVSNPYLSSKNVQEEGVSYGGSQVTGWDTDEELIGPPPPPNISGANSLYFSSKNVQEDDGYGRSEATGWDTDDEFIGPPPPLNTSKIKENSEEVDDNITDRNSRKRTRIPDWDSDVEFIEPSPPNISASIEAGLQFLRNKVEKRTKNSRNLGESC